MIGIRCMETGRVWIGFPDVLSAVVEIQKYGHVLDCGLDRYTIRHFDSCEILMSIELIIIHETEPMSSFPLPIVVGVDV